MLEPPGSKTQLGVGIADQKHTAAQNKEVAAKNKEDKNSVNYKPSAQRVYKRSRS